jgi:hypothetical protein
MEQIKNFIDKNYGDFSQLEDSEVCELELNDQDLNDDIINYLKENDRYDYRGICVYYHEDKNEIWIENMEAPY